MSLSLLSTRSEPLLTWRPHAMQMWNSHSGAPLEVPAGDWRGGMSVFNHPNSTTTIEAKSVKVWTMGSVWATEQEVLATPRRDGK